MNFIASEGIGCKYPVTINGHYTPRGMTSTIVMSANRGGRHQFSTTPAPMGRDPNEGNAKCAIS